MLPCRPVSTSTDEGEMREEEEDEGKAERRKRRIRWQGKNSPRATAHPAVGFGGSASAPCSSFGQVPDRLTCNAPRPWHHYCPPVCSMATSIRSSSSSPSFSAVSSGAILSPSTMKRTCDAWSPRRLQYASISFRRGVDFLILNCTSLPCWSFTFSWMCPAAAPSAAAPSAAISAQGTKRAGGEIV